MRRFLGKPGKMPPPTCAAKQVANLTRVANTVCWAASVVDHAVSETPSGERGDTHDVSPSVSPPPFHKANLWGNQPKPPSTGPELDLWGVTGAPDSPDDAENTYKPPPDDPFDLQNLWESEERRDFY